MAGDPAAFCRAMLPKTSRTFALNVPMLPSPLDRIVTTAYLLCRVADTVEDESALPVGTRVELLCDLTHLSTLPNEWRDLSASWAARASALLAAEPDQVELVAGLPVLLEDFSRMPCAAREIVHTWLAEMVTGMAETLERHESGSWAAVEDVDEALAYCDIVAGTVGHMLTALFAWHSGGVAAVLPMLEPRAAAFGRVLQLTNIVKDVRADLVEGRCWLPRTVLADCGVVAPADLRKPVRARAVLRRMIEVTHRELVEAIGYLDALPAADVGIRRFCTAPLLMSVLTLRKLWQTPEVFGDRPVKISRRAVLGALVITRTMAARRSALSAMFAGLRRSLPGPCSAAGGCGTAGGGSGRGDRRAVDGAADSVRGVA